MINCYDRKLVIFDLDGCLVDTAGEIALMVNTVRKKLGLEPLDIEFVRRTIGGGLRKILEKCLTDAPELVEKALSLAPESYIEISGTIAKPYPGVVDTLRALQGKRRIALATNKIRPATVKLFDALDITKYFDYMCCGDDCPNVKPNPECLYMVLENLGMTAKEAVMVGDTPTDVKTAANAGMDAIAVTYGMAKPEDVRASNPYLCVDSMAEVLDLLLPPDER